MEGSQRLAASPGRRFFGHFCWDLDEAGAVEGSQWPAANPGQRFFGRLCWDLDELGAIEGPQWPAANPGQRFFGHFCWVLDVIGCWERLKTAAWGVFCRFGIFLGGKTAKMHKLCYFSDKKSLYFGRFLHFFCSKSAPKAVRITLKQLPLVENQRLKAAQTV